MTHFIRRTAPIVALSLTPALAYAQVDDPDQAADAIYKRGKELYAAERYAEACPKFAAVHKIDPGVGSALYLGDCYEKEGKMASAREAFLDGVRLARAKGDDKRRKLAEVRLAAAEALTGSLRIELPNDVPSGFSVDLDERTLLEKDLNQTIPLDRGPHVVIARAPGYLPEKLAKEVKDGTVTTVKLAPLMPDPDAAWQIKPLQVAGLVIGTTGIAGLVVGGVFGARALSTQSDYETHCSGGADNLCRASGTALYEDARDQSTISTVAFVAGGALLGAGLTLFIAGDEAPVSPEGGDQALRVRVSPTGVTLGGPF